MDRLNNVNRAEGYYLTGETLEILAKQQDYLAAVLDGLNLPAGTVVFLHIDKNYDNATLYGGLAYVVNSQQQLHIQFEPYLQRRGMFCKVNGDSSINVTDLLAGTSHYKATINAVNHDTQVNGDTCTNSYITDSVTITSSSQLLSYKFYLLEDVLKKAVGLQPVDLFGSLSINGNFAFDETVPDGNLCNKVLLFNNYMDVQLFVRLSANLSTDDNIQFPTNYTIPLGTLQVFPNHLLNVNVNNTYIAYIHNNQLFFSGGVDNVTPGSYVISGRIYF